MPDNFINTTTHSCPLPPCARAEHSPPTDQPPSHTYHPVDLSTERRQLLFRTVLFSPYENPRKITPYRGYRYKYFFGPRKKQPPVRPWRRNVSLSLRPAHKSERCRQWNLAPTRVSLNFLRAGRRDLIALSSIIYSHSILLTSQFVRGN